MKLIFGCGYLGLRVGRRWLAAGETVCAVTRSRARAEELRSIGCTPLVADVTAPESLSELPAAETVLYAVGHDRTARKTLREVYVAGLSNVLDALSAATQRVLYISSTGVYAQSGGEWVDEESACEPIRESGCVCLEAERVLQAHRLGKKAIILRLAGIYGPGRIPRRQGLQAGEPIAAPQYGFLNLIHVDDAARIVLAAEHVPPPRLYTVSDGLPPVRHEYYAELARLLAAPPPTFVDPPADSPAALRAESNKRVSNRRLLSELDVKLEFPSYREGLAAIVASDH
jgi:nucleoside-diphosphate-sugar epimerase